MRLLLILTRVLRVYSTIGWRILRGRALLIFSTSTRFLDLEFKTRSCLIVELNRWLISLFRPSKTWFCLALVIPILVRLSLSLAKRITKVFFHKLSSIYFKIVRINSKVLTFSALRFTMRKFMIFWEQIPTWVQWCLIEQFLLLIKF